MNYNLSKLHFSISEYAGLEPNTRFFKSANQVETHLTVMRGPYGPPDSTHKKGGVELFFIPSFPFRKVQATYDSSLKTTLEFHWLFHFVYQMALSWHLASTKPVCIPSPILISAAIINNLNSLSCSKQTCCRIMRTSAPPASYLQLVLSFHSSQHSSHS